jgi:GT2 family glycosyltransferase
VNIISVIIPTCNRPDLLYNCILKLQSALQLISSNDFEVIITDDSTNTLTAILVNHHFPWIKWIEGPRKGPAANRNNGAKYADGDWLIFLDDDCLPSKNILQSYLQAIKRYPDYLAFEGRIYVNTNPSSLLDHAPINETGGCFWSCNIAINKEFFFKIGLFDESFPYASMEDVDLFYRIKKNTSKYKFIYEAEVLHPWRRIPNIVKSAYQHYGSVVYYVKKHPEEIKRLNSRNHLLGFIKSRPATFKLAVACRFKGFWQKLKVDIIWIYLGFRLSSDIKKDE